MLYLYLAGLTAVLWSISGIIIKRASSRFGNLFATAMVGAGNVIVLSAVFRQSSNRCIRCRA